KLPMNRKHPAFKCVNEWLEKYYKGVNMGISMGIKNLKDLEVKFVKENPFNFNIKTIKINNKCISI
ncbi:19432_t:CDS:2, partial [Gigaspora margarita]